MREIKFRAWDSKVKQPMWTHEATLSLLLLQGRTLNGTASEGAEEHLERFKIMQNTGLQDKNGKEIYEGDVILFDKEPFQVVWCRCGFQAKRLNCDITNLRDMASRAESRFEVIGNIYENQDLLEAT